MKITSYPQGFLVVDDTYTSDELTKIWEDIASIENNDYLLAPEDSGSAKNLDTGEFLKNNKSGFLNRLFEEGKLKYIVPCGAKLLGLDVIESLKKIHPALGIYENLNTYTTMLSYYDDGMYYKSHTDNSVFTLLTWFYREPRAWSGGDLILNDWNIKIEAKNNRSIIIPGSYSHKVVPIVNSSTVDNMGRYCLTQFCFVEPKRMEA